MTFRRFFVIHANQYIFLLTTILVAISCKTFAQGQLDQKYIINQYNTSNGLSQNSAKLLDFDAAGNLWIGTEYGLNCFDGQNITYSMLKNQHPRISRFFKTESKELIVADNIFNIYKIDPNTKSTKQIYTPQAKSTIDWLHYMTGAPYGEFKTFAKNDGQFFSNEFYYLPKSHAFLTFVKDKDLYFLGNTFKYLRRIENTLKKLPFLDCLVLVHKDHSVEIVSGNGAFFQGAKLAGDAPDQIKLDELLLQGNNFSSANKNYILYKSTIYQIVIDKSIVRLRRVLTDIPPIKNISSIAFDENSGMLALGTYTDGFFILYKNGLITQLSNTDYLKSEIDHVNIMYSLIPVGKDKVLSTNGYLYQSKAKSPVFWKESKWLLNKDVDMSRRLLYTDLQDNIWSMSNDRRFLYQYDSTFRKVVKYRNPTKTVITGMLETSSRKYYFHTISEIFVLESDSIRLVYQVPNDIFSPKYEINKLKAFDESKILIATSLGLYSADINCSRVELCENSPAVNIRDLYQLKDKSLLLGTYGTGIFVWKQQQFLPLPLDKDEGLTTAHTFVPDANGFLWITSNSGLFQVLEEDILDLINDRSQQLYYYKYCTDNGLLTNEFNGGCSSPAAVTKDGTIFFPSMNGVVVVNPKECKPLLPTAPMRIYCNVEQATYSSFLDKVVTLPAGFRYIDLSYSILYYGVSSNLVTEYRLVGVDTAWLPIRPGQKIRYSNLPSGGYTFEIRKIGPGFSNIAYEQLQLVVEQKFYEKWWFQLGCFLLLMLIYWLGLILHSGKRRKDNIKLTKLIQEQTQQLVSQNKSLESSNKLNEVLISVLMHDINGPLNFQIKNAEMITQNYDRVDEPTKKKFIDDFHESSRQMHRYVYRILNWLKFRNQSKLEIEPISLSRLCQNLLPVEIAKLEQKGNVEISFEVPDNCIVRSNQRVLSIVLTNIVDNAIKYTPSGYVKIMAVKLPDNKVQFICKDSGKGMSPQTIEKLLAGNPLSYESVNDKSFELGYVIIKELLQLIDGKFEIESELGQGTSVVLTLPGDEQDQ